jgi:ATP-dependent protease ClpP protease subunit
MEDIYWGTKSDSRESKRQRTEDEDNGICIIQNNKPILFHPLIYTISKEVHFSAGISKETIELFKIKISRLIEKFYKTHNEDEELKITYVVDSPGGSVSAILKFVDFIRQIKRDYPKVVFSSVITGTTASAGTTMCIVADHRYITKNASTMIHELSSGNQGRYTQMKSYSGHLTDLHKKLVDIYLPKFKGTPEELEELLKNDTWYTAEQYMAHGFVDEIK